jgi:hypothetical protein
MICFSFHFLLRRLDDSLHLLCFNLENGGIFVGGIDGRIANQSNFSCKIRLSQIGFVLQIDIERSPNARMLCSGRLHKLGMHLANCCNGGTLKHGIFRHLARFPQGVIPLVEPGEANITLSLSKSAFVNKLMNLQGGGRRRKKKKKRNTRKMQDHSLFPNTFALPFLDRA